MTQRRWLARNHRLEKSAPGSANKSRGSGDRVWPLILDMHRIYLLAVHRPEPEKECNAWLAGGASINELTNVLVLIAQDSVSPGSTVQDPARSSTRPSGHAHR